MQQVAILLRTCSSFCGFRRCSSGALCWTERFLTKVCMTQEICPQDGEAKTLGWTCWVFPVSGVKQGD